MRSARDAPVDNMGAEKCMDEQAAPEVNLQNLFYCKDQSVGSFSFNLFCFIWVRNMSGKRFGWSASYYKNICPLYLYINDFFTMLV